MKTEPVAIVGLGCVCAAGENLAECLTNLYAGRRDPRPSARIRSQHPQPYPLFEMPAAAIAPEYRDGLECYRCAGVALTAARQAVADAGLTPAALRGQRVGVCLGTTVGSAMNNEEFYISLSRGEHPDLRPIREFLSSSPAAVVSEAFGLTGPRQTVVTACSSGTVAIGEAAAWIRHGLCDVVLAGGADAVCRVVYNGFISLLVTDQYACRPFDVTRQGLNLGEGAGVLVLESYERSCRRRGATPRGAVLGYGNAADAYHLTAPRPDGAGLRAAIAQALAGAGKRAGELAFINAHGTGTPDNDRVEGQVFAELLPGVPYGSTKGFTGHALGAAGGLEACFTLGCLEQQQIPGSIGFTTADPDIPVPPVAQTTRIAGDCALSTSLAFGGNNAALVLGRGWPC